ncbi:Copper amine oxidase N-terminal domain-containing protein [Fontibacillus panacisegetis]|uniref:Copper amine oxidase N-terminal domain-containing protein n=1 Tax=Fontibacillus panacisegetis TaxID=670482 RepID=A0A1G7GGZ8_9BACL|nr:copper amine oxidase N-terminal domain-containing protein [Fontibacillus panacisegetis]SDE87353.1 Copper amine oxidase N-terminal domain-containing protein [Fontibacillus panacisegetis]
MNLKSILIKTCILTGCMTSLLFSQNSSQATAQTVSSSHQAQNISIIIQGSSYSVQSQPFLRNGTVYIPLREVSNGLSSAVTWNSQNKQITISQPGQKIIMTLGKATATRNNKEVKLANTPIIKNNQVYVSIRSVAELMQAKVNWNSRDQFVEVTPNTSLMMVRGPSHFYWLNRTNGEVHYASSSIAEAKLAGIMTLDIKGFSNLDLVSSGKLEQLILTDSYGEPMINTNLYSALMVNGSLVKQTKVHYWQRFVFNVTYLGDRPVMTDGKMLYVLDSAGEVKLEYDLVKIVGLDEIYSVEGIGEGFALVRPNSTGLLTLINLQTLDTVQLYKQLNGQEQEYAEHNDVPYHGDEIKFEREKDGVLFFSYNSIFDGQKHNFTYKLDEK